MKTIIFDGKAVVVATPKSERRPYEERAAMRTAWLGGETLASIAKRYGISPQWVHRLIESVTPRKNPPKL